MQSKGAKIHEPGPVWEPIWLPTVTVTNSVAVEVPVDRLGKMVEVPLKPELYRVTVTVAGPVETSSVTVEKTERVVVLHASALTKVMNTATA